VQTRISGITLECQLGDIVCQKDMTAIVNAANADLAPGGGVAGAIHRVAGYKLNDECREYAPIKPGEAVITGGHHLPNRYVIHTLGPVYGEDEPEDLFLANCYRNSLLLADENGIDSIAFPAISTGVFGYPVLEASRIAFTTILATIPQLKNIRKIRIVLFSENDFNEHCKVLAELISYRDESNKQK